MISGKGDITMNNFCELDDLSLLDINGGTFFGVLQGVCLCAVGTAGVVGGIAASSVGIGVPAVVFGAATYADGIATIVSNM